MSDTQTRIPLSCLSFRHLIFRVSWAKPTSEWFQVWNLPPLERFRFLNSSWLGWNITVKTSWEVLATPPVCAHVVKLGPIPWWQNHSSRSSQHLAVSLWTIFSRRLLLQVVSHRGCPTSLTRVFSARKTLAATMNARRPQKLDETCWNTARPPSKVWVKVLTWPDSAGQ